MTPDGSFLSLGFEHLEKVALFPCLARESLGHPTGTRPGANAVLLTFQASSLPLHMNTLLGAF